MQLKNMSMKSNNTASEIKDKFQFFFENRSKEQRIKHDEFMLMASFLSEIEKVQKVKNFKRNKLAELIGTSASYLTQVFRGDKPLNFNTLAKIQGALKIRFSVDASYKIDTIESMNEAAAASISVYEKNGQSLIAYTTKPNGLSSLSSKQSLTATA